MDILASLRTQLNALKLEILVPVIPPDEHLALFAALRRLNENNFCAIRRPLLHALPIIIAQVSDEAGRIIMAGAEARKQESRKLLRSAFDPAVGEIENEIPWFDAYVNDIRQVHRVLCGVEMPDIYEGAALSGWHTAPINKKIHQDPGRRKGINLQYIFRFGDYPFEDINGGRFAGLSLEEKDLIRISNHENAAFALKGRQQMRDQHILTPFPLGKVGILALNDNALENETDPDKAGTEHCSGEVPKDGGASAFANASTYVPLSPAARAARNEIALIA